MAERSVLAGSDFHGTVKLTNHGSDTISIRYGAPLYAVAVRPGTRNVVAPWFGGDDLVGHGASIAPGKSIELPFQAMTTDCDVTRADPAISPGRYGVVVVLPHEDTDPTGKPIQSVVLSTESPLDVLPT